MTFVDTNYFLRFFLADVNAQHMEAVSLFTKAAGGAVSLFSSTVVFFELYWVATSFYEFDKFRVCSFLADVLSVEFVLFSERTILRDALGIYKDTGFDLEDAYNLAYAKAHKAEGFVTFDVKLQKKAKGYL